MNGARPNTEDMSPCEIRTATREEWPGADGVADSAFRDYEAAFPDWIASLRAARLMSRLGEEAELVVAARGGELLGACGYLAPGKARHDFFPMEWSILRMLSVPPENRGRGIARALVLECISRSRRDGARILGLYTSPVMKAAVPLYVDLGFVLQRELPPELGMRRLLYALEV
jgi:ribosomal protein S18 acetylase RimI-like enzyme